MGEVLTVKSVWDFPTATATTDELLAAQERRRTPDNFFAQIDVNIPNPAVQVGAAFDSVVERAYLERVLAGLKEAGLPVVSAFEGSVMQGPHAGNSSGL